MTQIKTDSEGNQNILINLIHKVQFFMLLEMVNTSKADTGFQVKVSLMIGKQL